MMENLRSWQQRLVYLITYSRADPQNVASREAFAVIIENAFEQLDVARVEHWVVSEEKHQDNGESFQPTFIWRLSWHDERGGPEWGHICSQPSILE